MTTGGCSDGFVNPANTDGTTDTPPPLSMETMLHKTMCPGGRPLTDTEVLERLLYQGCEQCKGNTGWLGADGTFTHMVAGKPCPSCGGSGRTLKDGVEKDWNGDENGGHWVFMVPVSMLEGGESV